MSVQTMASMVQWVENNIQNKPTLKEMSAHVGYSPYYCSAKFREHTGVTYKQFLARYRLYCATQDLLGTQHTVTDIAFRYGYSSPEAFTRAFVNSYRCTPRQYRKCPPHPLCNAGAI